MPGIDHTIELQNPFFQVSQLGAERGETCSSDLRHSFVVEIGNNPEQFFDALAANWRDDPKLGKMGTDRIDYRSLPIEL